MIEIIILHKDTSMWTKVSVTFLNQLETGTTQALPSFTYLIRSLGMRLLHKKKSYVYKASRSHSNYSTILRKPCASVTKAENPTTVVPGVLLLSRPFCPIEPHSAKVTFKGSVSIILFSLSNELLV